MNRIAEIARLADPEQRGDLYLDLDEAISLHVEPELSDEEVDSVLHAISVDREQQSYPLLWRFVLRQSGVPRIVEFAQNVLHDLHHPCRDLALRYLRWRAPDVCASLCGQYRSDSDPAVRFEVLLFELGVSSEDVLLEIIELMPLLGYDQWEEAETLILKSGRWRHAVALRRLDQRLGTGSGLLPIADELETQLSQQSAL